jgi:hypothetical protein
MPKGAMVANRHEPETYADLEALPEYKATREIFKQAGWEPFLKKFNGYDDAITLQFALHFNGETAKVGGLEFRVTEEFIAEAIELPTTGQRWTKGQPVDKELCAQLLKPQYRNTKWTEGTSRAWLEPQWAQLLIILQRYLTCEGRYTILFPCHARLLLHFTGTLLNVPFFLLKSLKGMAEQVQRVSEFRGSLFHFGLVKILITFALSKKQESWDLFAAKTLARAQSKAKKVKPISPPKKPTPKTKKVKTLTAENPEPEPPVQGEVETNAENGQATTPTEVDIAAPSPSPVADNIINVEELIEPIDQPRRNPKRKCKSAVTGMDDSIPSYPTQERLESIDGHEGAPEPSEMTWTLSQLIRKNRRTTRQATTPKKVMQNEFVQVPTGTSVQMTKEPTPEPSPANTDGPSPIDNYELSPNRDVDPVNPCELSPDHTFDPADTYEHSPVTLTPEFTPDHDSDRFHTPVQSPEELTHASSPPVQPEQEQTIETHCELSSSRSLKPRVARLENRNTRLKEKLHEYRVLDRHVKTENELLKLRINHLLSKIERLKQGKRDIFKRNKQLQRIAKKHVIINRVLKKEMRNLKKQERLQMLVAAAATL